jgi:hypothetical protein
VGTCQRQDNAATIDRASDRIERLRVAFTAGSVVVSTSEVDPLVLIEVHN